MEFSALKRVAVTKKKMQIRICDSDKVNIIWHITRNDSRIRWIYFHVHPQERAKGKCLKRGGTLSEKAKTWKVIGRSFCPSHSNQANQVSSLPVEPVGNRARLPIGARGDTRRTSPLNEMDD